MQEKFDEEITNIASSIKKEFQVVVDRQEVIAKFCNLFEAKIEERWCFLGRGQKTSVRK